ncbi:MAG TPA: insulinase family protein, partial [Chitinophagales bacterium]|nr:insulinase family protein [Chitinophagales bacterium]
MRQATWIILLLIGCHFAAMAQNQTATEGKYSYEYALNDPTKTRIYTLDNGLKVYLAINKDAPRIQTSIAVRTGSKNDPRDNTGLAHYLEHMLFKGTSRIATKDWDKEKALLQQISDLYEQHKATPDPAQKQRIYQQIDSLSLSASQYAIPNEYDKMISSLGAKGTNAYTSTDETVYINDIPSTGVEKWLMVESERFQELVLRLFHTELEAVYEEYNMGQDNVRRKMYQATLEALFPTHPYN